LLKAYAIMYVIKAIRELITNNKYLIKIQKPKNKKRYTLRNEIKRCCWIFVFHCRTANKKN